MSILDLRTCHFFYVRVYNICMYLFKLIKRYVTFVNADGNIKYLERLAALKSLWGQWGIAKKNFRDEIEACRKKNNLVPSGNCRKCWGGCRG